MDQKFNRRQALKLLGGTLLFSLTPISLSAKENTKFVAVRIWPANSYTRITIETDHLLEYKYYYLQSPERLVLDIQNSHLDEVIKGVSSKILARDPYIAKARVGQFDQQTIRIVFDLKQAINPQVFTLKPVAEFKNRLVIDLYPKNDTKGDNDPLYALLQEYNKGQINSDGSIASGTVIAANNGDALGDKIGELINGGNKSSGQIKPPNSKPTSTASSAKANPNKPATSATTSKMDDKVITASVTPTTSTRKNKKITVMLDPGHGGEDPGARGPSGTREKDVVLNIARETRTALRNQGFKVYMTRDEDVFIPLRIRVAKARQQKADIFVSIHADAFNKPTARGTGVYALSQKGASSVAARYLADSQNQSDEIGGVKKVGDKNVDNTLFDLTLTATINKSMKLGDMVLRELGKINTLHNEKVNQANFAVLKAPDIASILVESAFISNPTEESLLRSSAFRQKVAQSITTGVKNFAKTLA